MPAIASRVPALTREEQTSLGWGHILALIALLGLFRLVVAARVGLGDAEAYYWTWSEQLAAGYLDHGPVVALVIRLSTALLGNSTLGVRAGFIVLSSLMLGLAAATTQRWTGSIRLAGLAVLLVSAMPAFLVAGGAANPDVPFCLLVMLACWVALRPGFDERLLPIWGLGLIVGVAVSTKLFGVLLAPALFVFAWQHSKRVWALSGASSLALLGALPVAIWNALHDWPTLRYHLVDRHTAPVGLSWSNLGKWIGGQLAYVSPWLLALFAVAVVALARHPRRVGAERLLWISLPVLLGGYGLICIVPGAEPHWPLAGYLPLVPAAAGVLATAYLTRRSVRVLTWVAGAASALLFVLFHGHILTDHGVSVMPSSYVARYDLSNELVGWPEIADRTARVADRLRRQQPGRTVVATGCHYTSCSQLRFAARGRFDVRCISPRIDQFDLTSRGDGSRLRDVDLLYLWDERFPYPAAQLYRCARVDPIEQILIVRAGRTVRRFELQLCRRFDGLEATHWPPRGTVSPTNRPSDRRDSWIRDSS